MKGFRYKRMSKTRIVDVSLEGAPGRVWDLHGTTMISDGEKWMPYPDTARQLIEMAQDYGWGYDDGILPSGNMCRVDREEIPYIRLLIGREPGVHAVFGSPAPGAQFHLTWRMPGINSKKSTWILGKMYAKTSIVPMWQDVPSLKVVRAMIHQEPVRVPSTVAYAKYA